MEVKTGFWGEGQICSAQSTNLRDSGIDLLKVGIPKLSADARMEQPHARMEQPHSRTVRAFKPRPPGKPLCRHVGNAPATYISR